MSRAAGQVTASLALVLAALGGCSQVPAHRQSALLTAGCSTRTAPGRPLAALPPRTVTVPGDPFAAVTLPGGQWAVASLTIPGSLATLGKLAVLAIRPPAARLVRMVTLPPSMGGASGMAVTHDGQLLLVAGGTEMAVVSVTRLERGEHHPVVGVLRDSGIGQVEVAVSGDDRYAFVTDETSGGLSVFNLALARRKGFDAPGVAAGIVPLTRGPVGLAIAPGGARLYVTTLGGYGEHGQLWAIDARRAEDGSGRSAVLADVSAGCQPVRVAVSPDGKTAWVTVLQSNALFGFATADLQRDPLRALRAVVPVGSEPVGLLLLNDGQAALVGNSNRGLVPGTTGNGGPQRITIVSTADALAHRAAVIGSLIAGGLFPRDLGYDQVTGQVLVPDFESDEVELLRLPRLP